MADTQPLLESLWVCAEHQHVHAPLLRRALQSAHPRARAAAVRTLGTWGPKVKDGIALLLMTTFLMLLVSPYRLSRRFLLA